VAQSTLVTGHDAQAAQGAARLDLDYQCPDVTDEIVRARTHDELDAVLTRVTRLYGVVQAAGGRGRKLYARALDHAVAALPRRLGLADRPAPVRDNSNVCVILTEVYEVGGHTRVAADITRLIGANKVNVILTDIYRNRPYRALLQHSLGALGFNYRASLLLKSPSILDRTVELYSILSAIRPSRILLLNHHWDVCAILATLPFRDVTEFIHHTDYEASLGATLPYARHVDLTFRTHRHCQAAGLSPTYASVPVGLSPQADRTEEQAVGLRTLATSGHFTKYLQPAAFSWGDWVVGALRGNDAQFIHIGPVNDTLTGMISTALRAAGIAPERYVFTGPVKSVAEELVARNVDVYVCSAPEGGNRATFEALAAGFPVVVPYDPNCPPLLGFTSPTAGWIRVDAPAELAGALERSLDAIPYLRSPAFQADLDAELGRFGRYVAGEPLDPVPTVTG